MDVHVKTSKETAILVFCRILFEVGQIAASCTGNRASEFRILATERLTPLLTEVRGHVEEAGRTVGDWFRGIFTKQKKKIKKSIPTSHQRKSTFIFLNFKCNIVNTYTFDKGIKPQLHFFLQTRVSLSLYFLCNLLFNKASSLQMIN